MARLKIQSSEPKRSMFNKLHDKMSLHFFLLKLGTNNYGFKGDSEKKMTKNCRYATLLYKTISKGEKQEVYGPHRSPDQ